MHVALCHGMIMPCLRRARAEGSFFKPLKFCAGEDEQDNDDKMKDTTHSFTCAYVLMHPRCRLRCQHQSRDTGRVGEL